MIFFNDIAVIGVRVVENLSIFDLKGSALTDMVAVCLCWESAVPDFFGLARIDDSPLPLFDYHGSESTALLVQGAYCVAD